MMAQGCHLALVHSSVLQYSSLLSQSSGSQPYGRDPRKRSLNKSEGSLTPPNYERDTKKDKSILLFVLIVHTRIGYHLKFLMLVPICTHPVIHMLIQVFLSVLYSYFHKQLLVPLALARLMSTGRKTTRRTRFIPLQWQ